MIHSFTEDLARSHAAEGDYAFWDQIYRRLYPSLETHLIFPNSAAAQRGGWDRLLILDNGHTIRVEEKVRETAYADFCLEYWSNLERRSPGWWRQKPFSDVLLYVIRPTGEYWAFDRWVLRRVGIVSIRKWARLANHNLDGFRWADAPNVGYTTRNLIVPRRALLNAYEAALSGIAETS